MNQSNFYFFNFSNGFPRKTIEVGHVVGHVVGHGEVRGARGRAKLATGKQEAWQTWFQKLWQTSDIPNAIIGRDPRISEAGTKIRRSFLIKFSLFNYLPDLKNFTAASWWRWSHFEQAAD